MASNAGWQTSAGSAEHARGGGHDEHADGWQSEPHTDLTSSPPLQPSMDTLLSEPMDQHAVESLLRRLVDRVEETERRYGQALDALHSRLDQLSQTTDAARSRSGPETADTFDRLHAQVSDLAKRLETEPSAHKPAKTYLDDFERLGRALSDGLNGDSGVASPTARGAEPAPASAHAPFGGPAPSPFAQSIRQTRRPNHLAPELAPPLEWDVTPTAAPADFDNRLTEMANRLEQSIGAAMPSSTIEALNARLEEVGHQIALSLEAAPGKDALEQVERQIADMGRQLNRAEEQLGRLGGVEERLLQLLARLEEKDAPQKPAEIDAAQLQEIAAKAAVEAARLVADDSQKTTDRLEAMQRELNAVGTTSRQADDRLNSTLQSVHDSLKQLVHQVERPAARATQPNPFTPKTERKRPMAEGATPAARGPAPSPAPEPAPQAQQAQMEAPQAYSETPQAYPKTPEPRVPDPRAGAEAAEARVKETLRERLDAPAAKPKPRNLLAAFERARAPHVEAAAPEPDAHSDENADTDLNAELGADMDGAGAAGMSGASEDMVAAARRAAEAAAAKTAALAESRVGRPARREPRVQVRADDQGVSRRRPYLIVFAAILLTISALLLYGRLGSRGADETGTIPQSGAALPDGEASGPAAATETTPAAPAVIPPREQSGTFGIVPSPEIAPIPGLPPVHDRVGQKDPGITDIPKSPSRAAPENGITPAPQLASLKSDDGSSLPSDVVFSVEEPASATEVAMAEKLTTTSAKGPMPPEAIGSKSLRQAAASGNPVAQYTVGLRYIDGRGVMADPKTGSEWMERAARSGLAPAQYRLGTMYERGVGVPVNMDTARSWYLAAAERGNVKAMHNLAVSVSGGAGAAPNYALASKWYGQAALRGLADSQFNLAILAEHGLGQTKDLAAAYKWYVLAAKQGDTEAQKRRDIVSAQLSPKTIVTIDGTLATWKPKARSPEANTVTEPASWDNETASSTGAEAPQASTLVSRAQTLLNKLGYDVGVPDGLAGEKTRAGVKRFQERNGLAQTGKITVMLVSQLEALAS